MHLHPLILSPYRFQSVSLSGDLSNKGLPLSPYSVPLFPPARHPGCLPSCLAWDPFSRLSLASFSLAPLSPLPCPPRKPPFPPCLEPPVTVPPTPRPPPAHCPGTERRHPQGPAAGSPRGSQTQASSRQSAGEGAPRPGDPMGRAEAAKRERTAGRVPRLQRPGHPPLGASARSLAPGLRPASQALGSSPSWSDWMPSCPAPPVAAPPQRGPHSDQWAPSTPGEQGGSQCTPQHPLLLKDPHLRNLGL